MNPAMFDSTSLVDLPPELLWSLVEDGQPTLVHCWARWNLHDQEQGRQIDVVARRLPSVRFVAINVDGKAEIARRLGLLNIPTLIIFIDGVIVAKRTGIALAPELDLALSRLLDGRAPGGGWEYLNTPAHSGA